jgi:hypothetical protein
VLYGLPNCTIQRLQILQNRAAKVVLKWKPRDSLTEAIKLLHWLPVYFRIKFKIACIIFKCLNESDSPYVVSEKDSLIALDLPTLKRKHSWFQW